MKSKLFFLLFIVSIQLHAQVPALRNFAQIEYQGGTQNWDIDISSEHRMMFANNNGILFFDGDTWGRYMVSNYTAVRSVFFDSERNVVFAGASDEFGYFAPNPENYALEYHSLHQLYPPHQKDFGEVWKIVKIGSNVVFQAKRFLFVYSADGKLSAVPVGHVVESASQVGDKLYLSCRDAMLVYAGGKLSELPGTELLHGKAVNAVLPYDGKLLFVTSTNGLYLYENGVCAPFVLDISPLLVENQVFCAAATSDYLAFGTVKKGLIVKDIRTGKNSFANIDTGLQNNTVLSLRFDDLSNIWVGLDNGISYVMLSWPYRSLLGTNSKIGTGYASIISGSLLYLGTNQGLFTLPYPLQNAITPEHPQVVPGVPGQIWSLRNIYGQLLCGANEGAFVVSGHAVRKIENLSGTWDFIELKDHPGYALVCDYNGFAIMKVDGSNCSLVNRLQGFSESSSSFLQDADGSIWVSHWQKGVYRFVLSSDLTRAECIEHFCEGNGLKVARDNLICRIQGKIYVSSVDGFHVYDSSAKKLVMCDWLTKLFNTNGEALHVIEQPDGCLLAYKTDFFSTAVRRKDGTYEQKMVLSNSVKHLQMGLGHLSFIDSTTALMNNDEGFYVANHNFQVKKAADTVLVRNIYSTNERDTIIYAKHSGLGNRKVSIPHKLNSIRIEFVLPEYRYEKAVNYEYYLEGYDSRWSEPQANTSKEYTQLSKGNYKFHVRAHNMVDGSVLETELAIYIQPAWYETWLAYLIYILLGGGLVWMLMQFLKKRTEHELVRVRKEKEKELREQQLQFEVEEKKREAELMKLRNEQLEVDLKHKSSELADSTMNLVRKNDMLQMIDTDMEELSESVRREDAKARITKKISDIRKDIKMHMNDDANWEKFEENFNLVYDNFTQKLRKQFPELKKNDLKLCAYLRMGLSSKEMASLLNTSVRSVETARYRLRKKLSMDSGSNLQDFIQMFENTDETGL